MAQIKVKVRLDAPPGLLDRWRLQMDVHPAEDQLARLVGHAVSPAVDVEGKVLRRLFQLVDIHDPQ